MSATAICVVTAIAFVVGIVVGWVCRGGYDDFDLGGTPRHDR